MKLLNFVIATALNTPWWAWLFFAWIIFVGIRRLHYRQVYLPLLCLPPFLMFLPKYKIFFSGNYQLIGYLLLSTIIGQIIGAIMGMRVNIKIFKPTWFIGIPGAYCPLFFFLSFVVAKYVFAFLQVTQPDTAAYYFMLDTMATGFLAGMFAGEAKAYFYRFYKY